MPRTARPRVNGHAVQALRTARGLTGKNLAAAANISPSYLSDIESGRRRGNEKIAAALATALLVPAAALLTLDGLETAA